MKLIKVNVEILFPSALYCEGKKCQERKWGLVIPQITHTPSPVACLEAYDLHRKNLHQQ